MAFEIIGKLKNTSEVIFLSIILLIVSLFALGIVLTILGCITSVIMERIKKRRRRTQNQTFPLQETTPQIRSAGDGIEENDNSSDADSDDTPPPSYGVWHDEEVGIDDRNGPNLAIRTPPGCYRRPGF
ncbi:hypothetical protein J3459_006083 [Metarhizium acridum]|uniref:Uncharacterized protein n=1 Tax=Metarhizium acridum (strain CQMa 102) TaxID=655827 RepID=E9E345_METAQ|nr:uncharacterized protein MAC_04293 [Metarhizium acridum CQMa 102]EFY89640.1 hypothetical protein MAC_04293 [Metarhizium acridum CQMa 102]KAG8428090.1 hypothetical protein J3459_006083 [Metarhizium acridum]